MSDPASHIVTVAIAVRDPALAERLAAALAGKRFALVSGTRDAPHIVVADAPLTGTELGPWNEARMQGHVAVIAIGPALSGDVVLPVEFTRAELRLACRLLAQVVTLRKQNARLRALADRDPLTDLPNRRALERHCADLAGRASSAALALLDLDQFKRINAEQGYARGDEVLCAAAKMLAARAGEHFVARLGGDEFALLWHSDDSSALESEVDALRHAMGRAASLKAERPLSVSAGLACERGDVSFSSLLASADLALRQAKQQGGRRTISLSIED